MNSTEALNVIAHIGTNPLLSILSFIVAIISIILAYFFYKKSKKLKLVCYTIKSHNLIKDFINKIETLQITYAGIPIKNLTISRIAIWNAGNETIEKSDIVKGNPISIFASDGVQLLDATIIKCTDETNDFKLSEVYENKKVMINFDYFDEKEGAAIQVIHTGKNDKDIKIQGKLKGAGNIKYMSQQVNGLYDFIKLFLLIGGLMTVIFIVPTYITMYFLYATGIDREYAYIILFIFSVIFLISYKKYNIISKFNTTINKLMGREPKELELIEDRF